MTFLSFPSPPTVERRERRWMGYKRKRGKLAELNSFLRGGSRDRFSSIVGETDVLSTMKYVITLDTDTQLPRDSAWQLAGAMAHPLNRAGTTRLEAAHQRRIRHPSATRGCKSALHESIAICPNVRE